MRLFFVFLFFPFLPIFAGDEKPVNWTSNNFPNQRTQFGRCQMPSSSHLCDPDGVISLESRLRLEAQLIEIEKKTSNPGGRTRCDQRGVAALLAVVKGFNNDLQSFPVHFASNLHQREVSDSRCRKNVVFLFVNDSSTIWFHADPSMRNDANFYKILDQDKNLAGKIGAEQRLARLLAGLMDHLTTKGPKTQNIGSEHFKRCEDMFTTRICDPDGVLSLEGRFQTQKELANLFVISGNLAAPCNRHGVTAAIAVYKKLNSTEVATEEAKKLRQIWKSQSICDKIVAVTVSKDGFFGSDISNSVPLVSEDMSDIHNKNDFLKQRVLSAGVSKLATDLSASVTKSMSSFVTGKVIGKNAAVILEQGATNTLSLDKPVIILMSIGGAFLAVTATICIYVYRQKTLSFHKSAGADNSIDNNQNTQLLHPVDIPAAPESLPETESNNSNGFHMINE